MIATKRNPAWALTGEPEPLAAPTRLRSASWSRIARWDAESLGQSSVPLMRVSLGVIFLWFGALKFFPSGSPIQDLAVRTMSTHHLRPGRPRS